MLTHIFIGASTTLFIMMFAWWSKSNYYNLAIKIVFLFMAILGVLVSVKTFNLLNLVN